MQEPVRDPGRLSLPHLRSLEFPNQSIIQFVTVCVADRRRLLARAKVAALLLDCWRRADHWRVGRYVIMPDHIHLFCAPAKFPYAPLKKWVQFWRSEASRAWPCSDEHPIWQKDFFDRQLRTGESYHEKWLYVFHNPVRAGLVANPEAWPYQGELNPLIWHEASP
jgi:putative transposase